MSAAQDEFDALFKDDGKSSRHPEDQQNSSDDDEPKTEPEHFFEKDDDGNDEDDIYDDYPSTSGSMRSRYFLPSIQSNANTGPKGVIADAQAFEQAKKSRRISLLGGMRNKRSSVVQEAYRNEEKSSDEDDEGGFLSRWRQSRLKELQESGNKSSNRSRTSSPSKRIYGTLPTVDGDGYLDAIEKVHSETVVIVLIYDDLSDISTMVEACVLKLARKHATTRFVKLHYEEAEMENAGVPALLAYRAGEKFAGLVPVVDEIPEDQELSAESIEAAMKRHQIPL